MFSGRKNNWCTALIKTTPITIPPNLIAHYYCRIVDPLPSALSAFEIWLLDSYIWNHNFLQNTVEICKLIFLYRCFQNTSKKETKRPHNIEQHLDKLAYIEVTHEILQRQSCFFLTKWGPLIPPWKDENSLFNDQAKVQKNKIKYNAFSLESKLMSQIYLLG